MQIKMGKYTLRDVGDGCGFISYSLWENFDNVLSMRGPYHNIHGYYKPDMSGTPDGMSPSDYTMKVSKDNDIIAMRKARKWIEEKGENCE